MSAEDFERTVVAVISAAHDYASACADQEALRRLGHAESAAWSRACAATQARLTDLMRASRALEDRPTLPPELRS